MRAMDSFNEQAFGLLTSSKVATALDLSKEDPKTVARYGTGDPKGPSTRTAPRGCRRACSWRGGSSRPGRGSSPSTTASGIGTAHPDGTIFNREKEDFPIFDQCLSALIEDLHVRGLSDDCTVVVMGEFGRTPKISKDVGRDHWPPVNFVLLAGGGMKTGQVIGATDRIAGEAVSRPVTFGELYATLYKNLGIDVARPLLSDIEGRPHFLVDDHAQPIEELA